MTDAEAVVDRARMGAGGSGLLPIRLAIGLAQGAALYGLHRSEMADAWPAGQPALFGALMLTALFLPVVALGGLGRLRVRTLLIWLAAAGVLLMGLGWHDVARQSLDRLHEPFISFPPVPFLAAALFILHHLIVPADQERRWFASFPRYFDVAWKAGVQLALSILFTLALWLLLWLGAALFALIGLRQFGELLRQPWFYMPVLTVTFALAVHLTDVKDGLIRGVRSVALMLLSWLLPVIAALTAAFLVALPFTGLEGLWDQGSATALMLTAAAILIVLINAAYQDGTAEARPPTALRWAAMIGGILLVPLIAVATWGLGLRIGQHGLTPDRITAAACIVVGAVHAGGYAWATATSLRGGPWMKPLERTNILGALTAAGLILLLFSPVLDPARLSVMDQTARLARGAVTPARFDYAFLRFESGRAGEAALAKLAASKDPEIARRAKEAQAAKNLWTLRDGPGGPHGPRRPTVGVWPAGAVLPSDFVDDVALGDPRWLCRAEGECLAELRDVDGDGADEVLLANGHNVSLFVRGEEQRWVHEGEWPVLMCSASNGTDLDPRDLMRAGALKPQPSRWPDLGIGGQSVRFAATCGDRAEAVAAPGVSESVEVEAIEPVPSRSSAR